jgi:transcriptional regulator of acetoin/glycerol metabolism
MLAHDHIATWQHLISRRDKVSLKFLTLASESSDNLAAACAKKDCCLALTDALFDIISQQSTVKRGSLYSNMTHN